MADDPATTDGPDDDGPSFPLIINPFDVLTKSQQIAVRLTSETLRTIRDTAVTGVTQPDELLKQVVGLADAITGLAAATAQPMQDFLVRQRELADTMAMLASAQAELAELVAALAERHAATVTALERMTAPVFAVAGTEPTPSPAAARKKAKSSKVAKDTRSKP